MPAATINQAQIYYEVLGDRGPWFVVMSGGRHPLCEVESLGQTIAAGGCRVLLHDRRNCGQSSFDFDGGESEEDIWVEDLRALLQALNISQAFVIGKSRSVRVALRFWLRYPEMVRGLGLWGISGGPAAVRFLDEYYYGQYLRACKRGGMTAVCAQDHFAGRNQLLATDPAHFMETMTRWRDHFITNSHKPLLGFGEEELSTVTIPTAIVPYYDRMHPFISAESAHCSIPASTLFNYDPLRIDSVSPTEAEIDRDVAVVAKIFLDFERSLSWDRYLNAVRTWKQSLRSRIQRRLGPSDQRLLGGLRWASRTLR